MTTPLLATKLLVPVPRGDVVDRSGLCARLAAATTVPLTLLSAPPGFGKTTLLTSWLAGDGSGQAATVWVSLDQRDGDPAVFWSYLATALRRSLPGVGATTLAMLESGGWPTDALVTPLLNDLAGLDQDVVAVLDDYHVIDSAGVHDGVAFLLDHLPANAHLVVATRADPPLPLARLRAKGQLLEIRAADLRFTGDETQHYLNDVMGLTLSPHDVSTLERRTEGWIAALQLAALSMRGRADAAGFMAEFSGADRYIVDYLVEEVLDQQPESRRAFLLQTSILSRMTGSLCDALTGRDDGTATLSGLARDNMFVTVLDPRRRWYRYHRLFADVLQARLLEEQPEQVAELHRRASTWYHRNGDRSEAIAHALGGADFDRAADLVETAVPELRRNRQDATLRSWLSALPDELIRVRPVLSVAYAGALLVHGEMDGAEARLRDAEARLTELSASRALAEPALAALPGAIALFRAAQARITGDTAAALAQAERAAALAGEDDDLTRGAAAGFLGLTHWSRGELESAYRWWMQASASLEKAGHYSDVLGCTIALADIAKAQGRLHDAMSACGRGLSLAAEHAPLRGVADMHVGMAELLLELNDLEGAQRHLIMSRDLGDHAGLPQNRYRWRVALARLRHIEGDSAAALELLDDAERVYVGDYFPELAPVAAVRARLLLAQGNIEAARTWARRRDLSPGDDPSYLREYEHLTLARVLLAQAAAGETIRANQATTLLQRLLDAAEPAGRTGTVIEILVLQALAMRARGDTRAAQTSLQRALTLAEPEGYLRLFLDAGPAIAALLTSLAKQDAAPGLARRLLAAATPAAAYRPAAQRGLVEPLSGRELDVLRLLGTDLTGPEIARELVVSLNTVRTHTKNIYAKLGVTSRRAAVRRADELGLLR